MRHNIPLEGLGTHGSHMAEAVEKCVHCGVCLATCPTYQVLGEEMDSPRGRIFLMKETLEGSLELSDMITYVDRCLGCMACVTACPSGVEYGELLSPFRARAETERKRGWSERATRTLVSSTLPYPGRFRLAARFGSLAKPLKQLMPGALGSMLDLLPAQLPADDGLPEVHPAQGTRRGRVALLAGCVQNVLAPEINQAALRVLARNGIEVVIPQGQGCCGALSMHIGEADQAEQLAARNMDVFPKDVDAIITTAAGCGSGMHEYPLLFEGTERSQQAVGFASRVQDISTYLDALGIERPAAWPHPVRLAYHDACHLAHAQGIRAAPRRLLSMIENVTVAEIPEAELCCGSAGTYNLEQPEIAHQIGQRKANNIVFTQPDAVVSGNIGCTVQIGNHLAALGKSIPIFHTVQVLDQAYSGQHAV